MVRLRRYEDRTVLEAARERMALTLEGCDRIVVMFSGGKDSLAVLHLAREAQQAAGDTRPVLAVFRDLEFVEQAVLDKVFEVAARPWVDLHWWALPMVAQTSIVGVPLDHVIWDREQRDSWARIPPTGATTTLEPVIPHAGPYTAEERDLAAARLAPGRCILTTGVRAAESLIRYRSVVNKLREPWIVNTKVRGVTMSRPIYDWSQDDVLRYLWENDEQPATVYDAQAHAGKTDLRTASLLNVEAMRDLDTLAQTDPTAYARVTTLWPEAAAARRYAADLRPGAAQDVECTTLEEVAAWLEQRFAGQPAALKTARDRLEFARRLAVKRPDGYPAWWVQREISRQGHGTGILPLPHSHSRHGTHEGTDAR